MVEDRVAQRRTRTSQTRGHLANTIPESGEAFATLTSLGSVRIEHIVSSDSPDTGEQMQGWDEWVLLLSGAAELEICGERLPMSDGDWVVIPAGTSHRVLVTRAGTHWIAVHGPAV